MPDNNKPKQLKTRVTSDIEEPFVQQVSEQFEAYLLRRGYSPKTAHDYARDLHHKELEPFMLKTFGCRSAYWLTEDLQLILLLENFRHRGSSMEGRVKNATMRYREFLSERNTREYIAMMASCIERELKFKAYLLVRGLTEEQAIHDSQLLYDRRVIRVLGGNTCNKSLYEQTDLQRLEVSRIMISGTKVEKDENVRNAISRYIDWLNDMNGCFAKACEVKDADEHKNVEIGQFEEMCDIAMHQNFLDAYNYHVMECMKSNGTRILNLNHAKEREYWVRYQKNAIALMCSDEYKELADHFLEFFKEDDRFRTDKIVRTIEQYAPGEKGWKYWQMLARWKIAERITTIGYEMCKDEWIVDQCVPFNEREVREMSNIERGFTIYEPEERKKCSNKVKKLFIEAERNKKIWIDENNYVLQGDLIDAQARNVAIPVQKEQTGTLEHMAMKDIFANSDLNALKDEIASLKSALETVSKERDDAMDRAKDLKSKLDEKEQEEKSYVEVDHAVLVGEAFCEIAQRYMNSKKRKSESQRKEVRLTLNDIMNELKLDAFVPKDLRICINTFDDEKVPEVPKTVKIGTIIMEQKNGTYIEKVMKGATGAINNNQK